MISTLPHHPLKVADQRHHHKLAAVGQHIHRERVPIEHRVCGVALFLVSDERHLRLDQRPGGRVGGKRGDPIVRYGHRLHMRGVDFIARVGQSVDGPVMGAVLFPGGQQLGVGVGGERS